MVSLAAINDDPLGSTMPLECLAQETFGSSQISSLAEQEFNRVPVAVDCSVKIHPAAPDLDIGLVDVPLAGDGSLTAIEPLQQLG
jgi:hypothetical protein